MSTHELILFDLGGVVIRLTGVETMMEWCGGITSDEVWERWLRCEAVRRFESGSIDEEAFGEEAVRDLKLSVGADQFLQGFRSWIGGTYDGIHETIGRLRQTHTVGCLSNTNAIHWQRMTEDFDVHLLFDHHFLSHHIGLLKPDREVFEHIVSDMNIAPERVLFLDDNRINVEGAKSVGLDAYCVKGGDEARALLLEMNLLSGEKKVAERS